MEWTITFHDQYAEVITTGIADSQSTQEMAKAMTIELSKNERNKVLMDHSNIEGVIGNISEVYKRHEEFRGFGIPDPIKIAEIVKRSHMHFFSFLTTVLRNRGFNVEIFFTKDAALAWLLEETKE
jgi:hypothetical protein